MYNVYDRSNVFYLVDLYSEKTYLLGNKKDLIKFLSNTTKRRNNYPTINDNEFFYEINMGKDFSHYSYLDRKISSYETIYTEKIEKFYSKRFMFLDGENRIIDVRFFLEEVFKDISTNEKEYSCFYGNDTWRYFINSERIKRKNKYRRKQKTRSHSGNHFKGTKFPKSKRIRTIDSMFKNDKDFKDYHFKPLEDSNNPYPDWFDDTSRRIEGNWKSQYKIRHQYDIHSRYKTDVRKNIFIEDFSNEEIDNMLEEDYKKELD